MPENNFENEVNYYSDMQSDGVRVQAKLDHHTAILGGMARIGRVVEFAKGDPKDPGDIPRVLVQIGGASQGSYIRNWMPWTTTRAGFDGEWWAPEVDEQVLVIAPSGNLSQGVIVGSLYRGSLTFDAAADDIAPRDPIPSDKEIHRRIYKDGSSVTYDRNSHNLSMVVKSAPDAAKEISATITADESIVLTAGTTRITINQDGAVDIAAQGNDITISGNVKVTGTMDVS
jgi:phage baseplate assembly protein V